MDSEDISKVGRKDYNMSSEKKDNVLAKRMTRHVEQSERLLQQYEYADDMYIKVETQRLYYFRHEQRQKAVRMESLQEIVDSLLIEGQSSAQNVDQKVSWPSSSTGSPIDVRKRYTTICETLVVEPLQN